MRRIERLVQIALSGTRQAQLSGELAAAPFNGLPDMLPASMPLERKLLLLAGAEAIYSLAGTQTLPLGVNIAPAPSEELAPCSPSAARIIQNILQRPGTELLLQALGLLVNHGRRLPSPFLPAVLARLSTSSAMVPSLGQALGKRGRWLSSLHPSWRKLVSGLWSVTEMSDEEKNWHWREGSRDGRERLLRQLRIYQPSLARQWAAQAWPEEGIEQRLALLEVFALGLEQADEPFLEQLRYGRSQRERRLASELLVRLPASNCRRELLALAGNLLQVEQRPEGCSICIHPPEVFPPEWKRFGLSEEQPRTQWLSDLISLVPPNHWEERLQLSPSTIVSLLESDWRETVLAGLRQATLLHGASSWARALLSWADPQTHEPLTGAADLLVCLPKQEAEQFLIEVLISSEHPWHQSWGVLLSKLPQPWGASFGNYFLAYLQERLPRLLESCTVHPTGRNESLMQEILQWRETLKIATCALPTECLDLALQVTESISFPEGSPGLAAYYTQYTIKSHFESFVAEITLLHDLEKELASQ
ncbi:DUF5691 domain-containing protein [Thermogemmatispora sp.]|uniref:DUF5691 domain-containing protein n=1 Tax=Thermogemmatispora sp. TaxID=1968838 RepID=UPI0035E419F4